jgi:excisionase family DNA binding protein
MKVTAMSKALPKGCLSINEVAEYVGCAPLTIKRLIYAKKLHAVKFGRRVVIRPSELERYCGANPA